MLSSASAILPRASSSPHESPTNGHQILSSAANIQKTGMNVVLLPAGQGSPGPRGLAPCRAWRSASARRTMQSPTLPLLRGSGRRSRREALPRAPGKAQAGVAQSLLVCEHLCLLAHVCLSTVCVCLSPCLPISRCSTYPSIFVTLASDVTLSQAALQVRWKIHTSKRGKKLQVLLLPSTKWQ